MSPFGDRLDHWMHRSHASAAQVNRGRLQDLIALGISVVARDITPLGDAEILGYTGDGPLLGPLLWRLLQLLANGSSRQPGDASGKKPPHLAHTPLRVTPRS